MACKCNIVLSWLYPPRNPDVLDEKGVFAMYVWSLVPQRQAKQHLPDRDQDPDILIRQTHTQAKYSFA